MTRRTYSLSFNIAVFSFHSLGPGGMESKIETWVRTQQWSEKGFGTTENEVTDVTQRKGTPTRSIREVKAPFYLVQVNPGDARGRYR